MDVEFESMSKCCDVLELWYLIVFGRLPSSEINPDGLKNSKLLSVGDIKKVLNRIILGNKNKQATIART